MLFESYGRTYKFKLKKGNTKTRMGGEGWERFLARFNLKEGDMICFSMTGHPKIDIAYVNNEPDPFEHTVFAQRLELSDDEIGGLLDLLPPIGGHVGFLFVTRLTSTNLTNKHVMVCFQSYYIYLLCAYHLWFGMTFIFCLIINHRNYLRR